MKIALTIVLLFVVLAGVSGWAWYDHARLSNELTLDQEQIGTLKANVSLLKQSEASTTQEKQGQSADAIPLEEAECAAHYKDPDTRYLDEADQQTLQTRITNALSSLSSMPSQISGAQGTAADLAGMEEDGFYSLKYNDCLTAIRI